MLPERLCNYICSLRPDEEKLCYSVIVSMDEQGVVANTRIVHTVIKSNRRYAYEEVQQLLEENGVKDGTGQPLSLIHIFWNTMPTKVTTRLRRKLAWNSWNPVSYTHLDIRLQGFRLVDKGKIF